MKRIFLLIVGILFFSGNLYAENINSTRVNEALKDSLDRYGRWRSIIFSDGTEMSTSAGGMSAATYDPQAIAGDAFDLALHTGDIAGVTPPYIAQTSGTGTGNVLTNTTLDGTGTISANVSLSGNITANSLLITPTELSYINNVSSEIQSQITTATGSITNHVHSGSDGTIQIAHDSITGTGTNSHATLDTFITSKAQASGLASLDGSSLVVQNPANSTATPEASKILIADGSGKIADGWLSTNVSLLGQTIAHDSITGTGTNSHATIDTHLANTTDPHGSTLTQTSATIAGVDAPYIAQANGTGTGNTLTGLTVNGVTGLVDSDVPNTITLDNITQITNRSHTSLSDIGTNAHTAIDSHIDDTIDPHGVTLTQTAATIAGVTAPYIAQTSGTGTGLTLAGDTNFPSGIWNSSGNVGIGMGAIAGKLCVNGQVRIYDGQVSYYTGSAQQYALAPYKFVYGTGTDESLTLFTELGNSIYFATDGDMTKRMIIDKNGNVGIGTTTPSNILTLPIASATDPIADAWTVHCLSDYKVIGTETAEMIQIAANDKIKTIPVSSFTKKAIISDDEAEREVKQEYQDRIRESAKADLELYTAETGVAMNNNSYVDELVNSMWETKADRLTIVEANKQKLIAEKKALPKFQRQQYGIVAEDAPPEAQVLREDGSLQGVDPYPLIGILWANAQKQDERIALLETQIADLSARVLALEGR